MVHLRSINYGSPDSVCVCLLNPLLCLLLHSCRASVPGALSVYIYNSQRRPVLISLFMVLYNKNRPCIKCTQTNHGLSNLYKYLYKFDIFLFESVKTEQNIHFTWEFFTERLLRPLTALTAVSLGLFESAGCQPDTESEPRWLTGQPASNSCTHLGRNTHCRHGYVESENPCRTVVALWSWAHVFFLVHRATH